MRDIGRDDVLTLFRVWAEDKPLIRCECRFSGFAVSLEARVVDVADNEVRLLSDDSRSQFVFTVRDEIEYAFGDLAQHTPRFERLLLVFYRPADGPADADYFCFGELAASDAPSH